MKKRKLGLAPGTVVFTGKQKVEEVFINHCRFDVNQYQEKSSSNQQSILLEASDTATVDWYDIRGLHDTELIKTIGNTYKVPVLAIEDVVDVYQRAKLESFKDGVFILVKSFHLNEDRLELETEHISIYFKEGLLFSFQEKADDLFRAVRKRIKDKSGRVRERGSDYLAYALLDYIVDSYFLVLDAFESRIESLEEELMAHSDQSIKTKIHQLKKELLSFRKKVVPLREITSRFSKLEHAAIFDNTYPFLRNLYDHSLQVMDTVENYRDLLNGLQDLYLSEISFKMNQVMQVLTIITTIFVPLSFLAGLYGMNFEYIPELKWRFGYFFLLTVMLGIALGLLFWFKNKKWL